MRRRSGSMSFCGRGDDAGLKSMVFIVGIAEHAGEKGVRMPEGETAEGAGQMQSLEIL